jgi:hypothetical protein
MSPLALVLIFVSLFSLVLVLIPTINSDGFERYARQTFVGYAFLISLVLFSAIYYFIGFDTQRNYRIPLDQQRRLTHVGYYIAPNSELTFSGNSRDYAFTHDALADDESIVLKPIWNPATSRADSWSVKYNAHTFPLRFNEECINLPANWWLTPKQSFSVYKPKGADKIFFSITWTADSYFGSVQNSYSYSQGVIRNGQTIYDQYDNGKEVKELLFSRRVLSEGRKLIDLISHPATEFANVAVNFEDWSEVFEGIQLVRQHKGNTESPIGILIANSFFQQPGLEIYNGAVKVEAVNMVGEREIPFNHRLSYGLGYKNSLSVLLSNQSVADTAFGSIVEVRLGSENSWPLPPSADADFIITSSRDYVPLDGYSIDVGQSQNPFYAKGKLAADRGSLTINDGKPARNGNTTSTYKLEEIIRLGDFRQGALLSLQPLRPAIPGVGKWAAMFLLVGLVLFALTILTDKKSERWRLNLSWTLLWGLVLTILMVRLVLSYRLSLLPPYDANPGELYVFHRSLIISFWSLLWFPLLMILVRHVHLLISPAKSFFTKIGDFVNLFQKTGNRQRNKAKTRARRSKRVKSKNILLGIYWTIPIIWILVAKALGENEALFVRINIGTHILIIIGIALTARKLAEENSLVDKLVTTLFICMSVALVIFLIGDRGFFIYIFSLLIYVALLFLWDVQQTYAKYIVGIVILSISLFAWGIRTSWAQNISYALYLENVGNRIASLTETESAVLLTHSDESGISVDDFLKSSQQHWQMMLYATTGSDAPLGYGRAPLTKKAMTYPTTMADCAFSTHLLSEHGKWAAFFFILLYAAIAFACFYASWFLPEQLQHRGLPLVAIGAFFACNAIYMSLANIKLVIFTGQNIPLLSLHSPSDLLQGGVLFAIATWMLSYGIDANPNETMTNRPAVKQAGIVFVSVLFILPIILLVGMFLLVGKREKYTEGYSIPKETVDQIERQALPPNSAWRLQGEQLIEEPYATISIVEKYYEDKFNKSQNKYDQNAGLYFLKQTGSQPILQVNKNYFKMESPFERDKNALWRGLIISRNDRNEASISAFGHPFRFSITEDGKAQTVPLSSDQFIAAGEGALIQSENSDTLYLEVKTRGGRVFASPKVGKDWRVYVDGVKIDRETELVEHSIIVLEKLSPPGQTATTVDRYNFIYLGVQPEVLAFVKWRNGKEQRVITDSSAASLVYTAGKAADQAKKNGQSLPDSISLTVDTSLQRKLQLRIEEFAKKEPHYKANDALYTDPIAVSVMDAFSGEILALPSWPLADPSSAKLLSTGVSLSRQARVLTNPNLTNHPIGSTIKPIVFSTLAHQLEPDDVSQLVVLNIADISRADKHLHTSICNVAINSYDCESSRSPVNASDFLVHSSNYYEVTLGMLGSIYRQQDFSRILIPPTQRMRSGLVYRGRDYACDLTQVDSPFTRATPQPPQSNQPAMRPRPRTEMDQTLLFQGLPMLFDVHVTSAPVQMSRTFCDQFFPSLCADDALLAKNDYLDNLLPERVKFDPNSFQDVADNYLRGFLIGANDCRWNNISMAEAAARLVTGQRISAKLEHRLSPFPSNAVVDMPSPLNIAEWRRDHLIVPMSLVGEAGGTASALSGIIPGSSQYRVMYKTGTIDEGTKGRHSEVLLFVLGRWDSGRSLFLPNHTITGFLYMRESREGDNTPMKKFDFARPIIGELFNYLEARR